MPIPSEHKTRFAYQFVDLENLESILRSGLLSKTRLASSSIIPNSIASEDIQRTRSKMVVTAGPGGVVHDYVPFYLCKRSSMLLSVIRKKNIDQQFLIYIAVPLRIVERDEVVFTNAAANRPNDPPTFYSDPSDLAKLDWATIDNLAYSLSDEQNHIRMSELLVHQQLDLAHISHIAVWNSSIAEIVREIYSECKLTPPKIVEDGKHFFSKWPRDATASLVTGPHFTNAKFEQTVKRILQVAGNSKAARYSTLSALRKALRDNISAVVEISELVGLTSESGLHGDLGDHTRKVVQNLCGSDEFNRLSTVDQLLVELAAYFHDIGKGPKSRWATNNGKYKNDDDHPLDALPMVERILTEDVTRFKKRSARIICKLVAYHDLIGAIVGKGRDRQQIYDVIENAEELDMLIALTKADTHAVSRMLWNEGAVVALRKDVVKHIKNRTSGDGTASSC